MSDTLSKATAALHSADNFDKSVAKQSGHEYSSAPYSIAKKAATPPASYDTSAEKSTKDIASGINWRMKQAHDAGLD